MSKGTNVAGSIDIKTFKISSKRGEIDLASNGDLMLVSCNIYESMLDPHTYCDFTVLDPNNMLGRKMIAGDETVEIELALPGENSQDKAKFKFAVLQDGNRAHSSAALKSQTYTFKLASKELLDGQKMVVDKSWNDKPTSDIVKDVVKTYWGSQDEVEVEETKKQRFVGNGDPPHVVLDKLKDRHVHKDDKNSSAFVLFRKRVDGKQKFIFKSLDKLADQEAVNDKEYHQHPGIASETSETADDMWTCTNLHFPETFNTINRYSTASNRSTYCLASGKQQSKDIKSKDIIEEYKYPKGKSPIAEQQYKEWDDVPVKRKPFRHTVIDKANDKSKTGIADMQAKKAAYLGRFTDLGTMVIPFNPKINVGDIIKIRVGHLADDTSKEESSHASQEVMVVHLRTIIGLPGDSQRAKMVVEFTKAGYRKKVE